MKIFLFSIGPIIGFGLMAPALFGFKSVFLGKATFKDVLADKRKMIFMVIGIMVFVGSLVLVSIKMGLNDPYNN